MYRERERERWGRERIKELEARWSWEGGHERQSEKKGMREGEQDAVKCRKRLQRSREAPTSGRLHRPELPLFHFSTIQFMQLYWHDETSRLCISWSVSTKHNINVSRPGPGSNLNWKYCLKIKMLFKYHLDVEPGIYLESLANVNISATRTLYF